MSIEDRIARLEFMVLRLAERDTTVDEPIGVFARDVIRETTVDARTHLYRKRQAELSEEAGDLAASELSRAALGAERRKASGR